VVNSGNAARSLPTLGLLTLTVVVFGIGLTPVLVPLVALAIPPILVNTYEGIRQVDADLTDAARCMGMTGRQVLAQVELPVALPLILLGLRTSAIQIVSTATIAAYVGLGGLGRFIVDGLERREYDQMAGGAVLAVAFVLLVEAAFVLLARVTVAQGVRQRNTQ
jgi:osmoprotectant transport system permease protein